MFLTKSLMSVALGLVVGTAFAEAQQTQVVPHASQLLPAIPTGREGRNITCDRDPRCYAHFKLAPRCFATNLRTMVNAGGYPLQPTGDVHAVATIENGKGEKSILRVIFPAEMTWPGNVVTSCTIVESSAPIIRKDATAGAMAKAMVVGDGAVFTETPTVTKDSSNWRIVECTHPLPKYNKDGAKIRYYIPKWKEQQNTGFFVAGYEGEEYFKYQSINLKASKVSGDAPKLDAQISCYYSIDPNKRVYDSNGNLSIVPGMGVSEEKVNCAFNSQSSDYSSLVKVINEQTGEEMDASKVRVRALMGDLRVTFLTKVPGVPPVKLDQGHIKAPDSASRPVITWKFYQMQNGSLVSFGSFKDADGQVKEVVRADGSGTIGTSFQQSAYKTYSSVFRFPGATTGNGAPQSFCGSYYSPLMFFFEKSVPRFTGKSMFPLHDQPGPVFWPEKGNRGYFLAYNKDKRKIVVKKEQLFGQNEEFDNGFEALKEYDDNEDGVIDSKDKIWDKLFLWNDKNGDGLSDPKEVFTMAEKGVTSIDLKYDNTGMYDIGKGASAREKSTFTFSKKGKAKTGEVIDIWLKAYDVPPIK